MSEPIVSDKKFCERLRRQADDGHHWDRAPAMLRESAERIERLRAALERVARWNEHFEYAFSQDIMEFAREALQEPKP